MSEWRGPEEWALDEVAGVDYAVDRQALPENVASFRAAMEQVREACARAAESLPIYPYQASLVGNTLTELAARIRALNLHTGEIET